MENFIIHRALVKERSFPSSKGINPRINTALVLPNKALKMINFQISNPISEKSSRPFFDNIKISNTQQGKTQNVWHLIKDYQALKIYRYFKWEKKKSIETPRICRNDRISKQTHITIIITVFHMFKRLKKRMHMFSVDIKRGF